MKKIVILDKSDNVTLDAEQAVIMGETEYDEQGHLVKETFYFIEKEENDDTAKAKE